MEINIVARTIIPIFSLIGMGLFSRKMEFLKSGDERVLSAYLYYFSLPALLLINLSEIVFTEETLRFMIVGTIPVIITCAIYLIAYFIFRLPKNTFYLLTISTIFGSLAFFGIPFITFAFPTKQAEYLATLSVSSISIAIVTITITILELYRLENSKCISGKNIVISRLKIIIKRLSINPLILSISSGTILSIMEIRIPSPLATSLHMLGSSTSAVAIFMLGVFLYGRKYTNILQAFKLSLLRMVFLPSLAIIITILFKLPSLESSVLVLMHGMPLAFSMMILSERYDFYKETISSLILISSLTAGIYLNVWTEILKYIFYLKI
jgi:predicted permease